MWEGSDYCLGKQWCIILPPSSLPQFCVSGTSDRGEGRHRQGREQVIIKLKYQVFQESPSPHFLYVLFHQFLSKHDEVIEVNLEKNCFSQFKKNGGKQRFLGSEQSKSKLVMGEE